VELTSISRYRIIEKLGSGGMGEVYLAEDTKLGRKVALKLLAEELTQNRDRLSRFDQEAYAASALNHPNILTIYEMGDEGGRHFIATEFIDGITLRKRLIDSPMDLAEVLNIAIQVAGALEEAHAARIVHRDIKPENIMIRRNGHVKVLDFGLAKLTEKPQNDETDTEAITRAFVQTDAGVVMGTSQYMSPEQARGKPVDARTDIWSLGVVLYEMATGRAPFTGDTKTDVIIAIAKSDPPPLARFAPNAPAEFEWIVMKALRKDVEERYQTVKEFETDLKKLKQRLEFQTEFERSVAPDGLTGPLNVSGLPYADTDMSGWASRIHTSTQGAMKSTASAANVTQTRESSVEYLVRGISRHKIGAIAGLVLLMAASAFIYYYYFRDRVRLTDKDRILIADFVNTTGDQVFDPTLKQALAVQLGQSPYLDIFSDDRVREQLKLMEKPPDERITREVAREICERQGIKAMLLGTISSLGSHYAISLEAVNAHTGDSIASEQVEAEGKEQVLKALGTAASKLREKLGESLVSVQRFDAPIEQATTSSLEALQAYSRGFERHSNGKYDDAINFYKDAIRRDQTFAIAYARLANCYNNQKRNELARETFEKAYKLRDRASEREKLIISVGYFGGVTGEWDRQLQELEIWKRTYPRDREPLNQLAIRYTIVGPFEKTIENAQAAIDLNPNDARPRANLAVGFLGLNRFEEAEQVIREALSKGLETANMRARLYQLAFMKADATVMQQQLDWTAGRKEEEVQNWQAQSAEFSGQLGKANQFNEKAIALARRGEVKETIAQALLQEADRNATFGNCAPVPATVKSALDLSRERAILVAAANALSACGQAPLAQPVLDELTKKFPDDTLLSTISIPISRAQLELNRGNAASAIQLLESANKYEVAGEFWPQYLRGQAFLKQGNGTLAAAEFKTIVDHRGWYPLSPLYPLAHLGMGRAAAMNSDYNTARRYYEQFFKFWAEADSTIPILIQARAEYEKLK
jgi:serine/threonine protein kinase/tetratricopeptide (TPR) repeat protein